MIFRDDGVSGSATDRVELHRALQNIAAGDVLVVWKLDRLGRSLAHLMQIITHLEDWKTNCPHDEAETGRQANA